MWQYRTEMSRRVKKKFLPVLRRVRKMGDKARRDYVKKCNRVYRLRERVCQKRYKRKRSDERSIESKVASKKKGRQSSGDQEDVVDKEASHPAKRRFSDRSSASGVVDSE